MILMVECFDMLYDTNASVILVGDMNFPSADWSSSSVINDNANCESKFMNFVRNNVLIQFVHEPIRLSNVLDIILSNDPFSVHSVEICDPFSTSDHSTVNFKILAGSCEYFSNIKEFYDYVHADWEKLKESMCDHDWSSTFFNLAGEDLWSAFYDVILHYIALYVPKLKRNSGLRRKFYPKCIRKLLSKKSSVWRKYKHFNTAELKLKYTEIAKSCRNEIHRHVISQEKATIESNNLGKFDKMANNKFSSKSGVGVLRKPDGSLTNDDRVKVELLNKHFGSLFTTDNGIFPAFNCELSNPDGDGINNIVFDPRLIYRVFKKLNEGSACGPDGIKSVFLKRLASELSFPLAVMFETFFHAGFVPQAWRDANITPIFKKGDSTLVSNYRPVLLTPVCCKP